MAMSPVPGGRSSRSMSRSPQYTSARNCCNARCSIGPRHTTGVLPSVNWAIEMTFTSWAKGGRIIDSTWVGRSVVPIIRGMEWPWISASSTPTDSPRAAIAAQLLAQLGALVVVHHVQADLHGTGAGNVGDRLSDAVADLGLLRAAGGGQVDRHMHAAAGVDVNTLDHPEFGDGAPQFWVDHLCQCGADSRAQVGSVVTGHHR